MQAILEDAIIVLLQYHNYDCGGHKHTLLKDPRNSVSPHFLSNWGKLRTISLREHWLFGGAISMVVQRLPSPEDSKDGRKRSSSQTLRIHLLSSSAFGRRKKDWTYNVHLQFGAFAFHCEELGAVQLSEAFSLQEMHRAELRSRTAVNSAQRTSASFFNLPLFLCTTTRYRLKKCNDDA